MKIKEISSRDFFGKRIFWKLDPEINILVGKNNTGKTTILRSIDELLNNGKIPVLKDFEILFDNGAEVSCDFTDDRPKMTGNLDGLCVSGFFPSNPDPIVDVCGLLEDEGTSKLFEPLLKELIPGYNTVDSRRLVRNKNSVEIENLSFSEKQLLSIIVKCPFPDGSSDIYLLDTPEIGLDRDRMEKIINALRKFNPDMQLIISFLDNPLNENKITNIKKL